MKKYHVHIYQIKGKFEMDGYASSKKEAMKNALKLVDAIQFEKPDCKHIVVAFLVKD